MCEVLASHGAPPFVPGRLTANVPRFSTLHVACKNGHIQVCEWLLPYLSGAGGNDLSVEEALNEGDKGGETPLVKAMVGGGHVEVCDWLVSHGAVLDTTNFKLLRDCCRKGHVRLLDWLSTHGMEAFLSMRDPDLAEGSTLMHYACEGWNLSTVEYLFNHGAASCVELPNASLRTPLHKVCERNLWHHDDMAQRQATRVELVKWLCDRCSQGCVNAKDQGGHTALWAACIRGGEAAIALCDALHQAGAEDSVSGSEAWEHSRDDVALWVVDKYGEGMSDEALSVPFKKCAEDYSSVFHQDQQDRQERMEQAVGMLRRFGPRVVVEPLGEGAGDEVVHTAVLVGVDLEHLQWHPRIDVVLEAALQLQRTFIRVFLFGCLQSSGSERLWKIRSKEVYAPVRRGVAEYLGVLWRGEEARRVREALGIRARASSSFGGLGLTGEGEEA